jgi:hypothetical protein
MNEIFKLKVIRGLAIFNIAFVLTAALVSLFSLNLENLSISLAILTPWVISFYVTSILIKIDAAKKNDA